MRGGIIARETLRQTYMIFALLVNIIVTRYMILNDDNMLDSNMQHAHYYRILYCGAWFICAWWYFKDKYIDHTINKTPNLIMWFAIFTLGVSISMMATHVGNFKQLVANLLTFITPCLSLIGSYSIAQKYEKKNYIFILIGLTILACAHSYFLIFNSFNTLGERGHFGIAYYSLYLLPIMLASDKRWIRIGSILIVSVVIISSIKRGGLVALVLGLLTYLIISRVINKQSVKSFAIMIATLLIMGVFFYMTISLIGDNILERLFDSSDDTGSGRLNIWQSLIQRLASQDIEAWILGNGHLSTTLYSWENLSAHNDFLEIIYDYGIINFLAYFAFFVSLARYTLQAIREKNTYAPSLAMMLVIYTILSMISIIVLSHTCTLAIISFGVLIGWNEHSKKSLEQS